jgi:hypothetical protein
MIFSYPHLHSELIVVLTRIEKYRMIALKFLFTASLFVLIVASSWAQANDSLAFNKVTVNAPARIDSIEKGLRGKTELRGYRIQIFLGDYNQAKVERVKFIEHNTGLNAYMPQNPPDYALRVGDFRSMLEASKYLAQIKPFYPNAFIVPDKVEPPRFGRRQ